MNGFKTIVGKELTRVFKDKKMVFSMFILPVILVMGICLLIFTLISNISKNIETHQSVVYIQEAPEDFTGIMKDVEDCSIEYIDSNTDTASIKELIKQGDADLLIVFPSDFTESVSNKETISVPQVKTFYNPSEDNSSEARDRFVQGYLESYRQKLITDRFGSTDSVMIFSVDSDNSEMVVQDDKKATGKMLGMFVPYFITIMLFAGAMGLGVDAMAGEKERGTLASLLLCPIKRVEIALGKLVALGVLSIMSALVYILAMIIVFPLAIRQLGIDELMSGLSISFTPVQILEMLILVIGIVLLYVAIVGLVSISAKTVKEAQTYVSPVYIVVMVAGMITMYTSDVTSLTSYMIPLYNTSVAFKGIFTGEITTVQFLVAAVITYGCAAILTGLIAKAFKSEKIMFNA